MSEIHLDLHTGLPSLWDHTGELRRMGRLEPIGPMALPKFRAHHAPIPMSEWEEIDLFAAFDPPVLDQGRAGSCSGHGTGTAFTLMWCQQGEDLLRFSPCFVYGLINGGVDRGAMISDTIDALASTGICLEDTVPEGDIFRRNFPPRAFEEASRYRLVEAYFTDDPADVATALQMGYAVADSVQVGRTFDDLDARGIAGLDQGPGNHCVVKGGMKKVPGGWAFLNQNSWGTGWGIGGRFLTTEAHIQAQRYYEAVVFRAVTPGPNAPRLL